MKQNGISFVHGDIRNSEDLDSIESCDILLDASAEPSVMAGINGFAPSYLINTNLGGTINCLNFALKCSAAFIFLSTSRVYPIPELDKIQYSEGTLRFHIDAEQQSSGIGEKGVSEEFPMKGYRSLYGATKLASELLIEEYNKLLGLTTIINRCGVIAGPHQMGKVDQGVAVLWVAKHFWNRPLSYIGYGGVG